MYSSRQEDKSECFKKDVHWNAGENATVPYVAKLGKDTWEIRVNDFPEKDVYSLLINGKEIKDFNEWPESWHKPENKASFQAKL
jgi:hypothetical protein